MHWWLRPLFNTCGNHNALQWCRLVWDFIYCSCPNLPLPSVYTRRPDAKISTPALPGPSKVVFFCGRGARVKNCARLTRGHKFFNGRGWSTVTMAGQCSGLYSPPIITRPNLRYCPRENADGRANEAAAETKLKHGQDSWKICYVSTWTSRDVCILHCMTLWRGLIGADGRQSKTHKKRRFYPKVDIEFPCGTWLRGELLTEPIQTLRQNLFSDNVRENQFLLLATKGVFCKCFSPSRIQVFCLLKIITVMWWPWFLWWRVNLVWAWESVVAIITSRSEPLQKRVEYSSTLSNIQQPRRREAAGWLWGGNKDNFCFLVTEWLPH